MPSLNITQDEAKQLKEFTTKALADACLLEDKIEAAVREVFNALQVAKTEVTLLRMSIANLNNCTDYAIYNKIISSTPSSTKGNAIVEDSI